MIACVIAAVPAAVEVPANGTVVEGPAAGPTVPVQSALSGQHAMLPTSSRAQLVFLGQQALLLPTEEHETAHLESRRKRSELMRNSSLENSSLLEAMKSEYSAVRAGGRVRQTVRT